MEPYVFARFEKLCFDADFNFELREDTPHLRVDSEMRTSKASEIQFKAFIKKTKVITNLVKLLSQSPTVNLLEVDIRFHIRRDWYEGMDETSGEDSEEESDEEKLRELKIGVGNERATELFLENDMLAPLRSLTNVKTLDVQIVTMGRDDDFFELQPKHAEMVQKIKQTVEGNWRSKHNT
ncbi:hypothetical protein P7C71_g5410, partial [Lecanoromycetidae sp. Uapishka_2]